jgi:DNA-binding transcriptional MocR family regulator
VAVEDPTFPGVLDALHRSGASVIGVPADDGVDPDRLEHTLRTHRPALVYLIPTHHNPTGLVMSAAVRRRVAALAAMHPDTVFVDDLTLAELTLNDWARHDSKPPLPLAVAGLANLVTVGSLSKVYWGGLRVGWIRGDIGLISRLAAAKATADLGSPAFQQAIVAALLAGQHDDIIKWRAGWLRERYDALADALIEYLPGWTWPRPEGGLTIWARLPENSGVRVDSGAFAQTALRHGVAIVPGRLLSATGGRFWPGEYLRLAFTQAPEVLTAAVRALAQIGP